MRPLPFSHSALECYNNCPSQYEHKYVLKDLPKEAPTLEMQRGTDVHKAFEYYVSRPGNTLPDDLLTHKPYLDKLIAYGNREGCGLHAERKVALSRSPFGVCDYFDKKVPVWWRGIIDVQVFDPINAYAMLCDFKTGKKKDDWTQLAQNAVWMFTNYRWLNLVDAQYYWTVDQTTTRKVWARSEMDMLVAMYADKLRAYAQSFKDESWPTKPSGLCNGWCPVTTCQFWRPKKEK